MNNQPFKQWGNQPSSGMIAFVVLLIIGIAAIFYGQSERSLFFTDNQPQFPMFVFYGGIVAAIAGLVGVIANSGK